MCCLMLSVVWFVTVSGVLYVRGTIAFYVVGSFSLGQLGWYPLRLEGRFPGSIANSTTTP